MIVPNCHASDWFDLTAAEQEAIMELVEQGKQWLEERYQPDGYNIGMNYRTAAGQTVLHMHCHLTRRYAGDQQDPRGGVRGLNYLNIRRWIEWGINRVINAAM